jgi:hypothetical protein
VFKTHFTTAYRQHKQMQGETADASGYANAAAAQPDDEDLSGASIDAFFNLATATAVDHGIVSTLTEDNFRLTKQLEDSSQTLKEIRALLKKERNDRSSRKTFAPSNFSMIITVGIMGTRLQEIIPARTVCIQKPDTNLRQTNTITWEDPKPTRNNWQGRHLNLISKSFKLFVPHPFYNIRTLQ